MTRSTSWSGRPRSDLERFKAFIEARGSETGGWRGDVNEDVTVGIPGAEDAAAVRAVTAARPACQARRWRPVRRPRWPAWPPRRPLSGRSDDSTDVRPAPMSWTS